LLVVIFLNLLTWLKNNKNLYILQCPPCKVDNEGKPDTTVKEPYGEEAKFFVESRLLQRDVSIILETVNNNNLVGRVIHPVCITVGQVSLC
jgi:hypothetical protein